MCWMCLAEGRCSLANCPGPQKLQEAAGLVPRDSRHPRLPFLSITNFSSSFPAPPMAAPGTEHSRLSSSSFFSEFTGSVRDSPRAQL